MWRSLFWKEWREQRWKAAFNTLLVTAFVAIGLRARLVPDQDVLLFSWFLAAMVLPLFVSVGLIAPERAEGSARYLLSLPTRTWRVLAAKSVVGILIVGLPFLVSAVVASNIAGGREDSISETLHLACLATWIGVQALIWYFAFGAKQPDEGRAGLLSLVAIFVWTFYVMIGYLLKMNDDYWMIPLPFGLMFSMDSETPPNLLCIFSLQMLILFGLWIWTVSTIRRTAEVKQ